MADERVAKNDAGSSSRADLLFSAFSCVLSRDMVMTRKDTIAEIMRDVLADLL